MARKRLGSDLYVYMNTQKVGILSRLQSGQLNFTYDAEWLESPYARPISLSMPLQEQSYKNETVYNYFDNLLPDNESLRARIQKRFSINTNHCFDLLSYIGADCVGALQLLSEPLRDNSQCVISGKTVTDQEIGAILKNYREAPLGMQGDSDFRISIAGAQEKTAFLKYKNLWWIPNGSTPTTHIFKLPIGRIEHSGIDLSESVENEWLCLQIMKAFDLPTNIAHIMEFDGVKALVCERFDRKWSNDNSTLLRLPQEDMCQIFGISSALKYESDGGPNIKDIMRLLSGSNQATIDRMHFFKTCIVFWILGAIDGHAKNFSVFIEPGGRFQLTPIYDVLSAYPLAFRRQLDWNKLKMAMSVRGKNKHYHWNKILARHWAEMAKQCNVTDQLFNALFDEIFESLEKVIDLVSSNLPTSFPSVIAESIFDGMRKVKK